MEANSTELVKQRVTDARGKEAESDALRALTTQRMMASSRSHSSMQPSEYFSEPIKCQFGGNLR